MPVFEFEQALGQLEKRRGGYFFLKIDADIIEHFEKKRHTRLICVIDDTVQYSCGLNHLGDGNYFIIVATKYLKKLKKETGDVVRFKIYEDPNPLGVAIPEVLQVLIEQDDLVKKQFEQYSDGKKRSLIYTIYKIKNIDLQVQKVYKFLEENKK
ncbi:DUF1905 domain-containing protein [marine bacterium AO1-C]|nr:DUF1905 domain-containing protein [marine bacterium AO1-C]